MSVLAKVGALGVSPRTLRIAGGCLALALGLGLCCFSGEGRQVVTLAVMHVVPLHWEGCALSAGPVQLLLPAHALVTRAEVGSPSLFPIQFFSLLLSSSSPRAWLGPA